MRFLTYENLAAGELAPKIEWVRAAIERDDFRTPDVKKLAAAPYYRAKLDDAARLLLTFVQHGGEKACLALEVIHQHDYKKSRFLRGAVVDEDRIEPVGASGLVEARPIRYLHPSRTRFHLLDKPLSFDDAQDEVLRTRPPLILVGSAGTGKTALMLQKLRALPGRVAYVTESAWLAQSARSLYVSHSWDPGEQEADFLSYAQLVESVRAPAGRPATFRDFKTFFERHRQKLAFTDAHALFEELRGVVTAQVEGVLSQEAYLALGVRQSIYSAEQRSLVHALLPAWRKFLVEGALYEPNLEAHTALAVAQPRYDFVVVDEVQDLTPAQLALILRCLKTPGQFIVGGDANQIVHPNFFSWARLKTLFWEGVGTEGLPRSFAILDVSYRNSEAVTGVANALLKVKHARFGSVDRESTYLMRSVAGLKGSVRGFVAASKAPAELDARTRGSAKVAVVVLREEEKAAAKQIFRTPLVFTVQEAKGLEYEAVVLFRVISSERRLYAELAEGITAADLAVEELAYGRAKERGDKSLETYKFYVNALYVALTRAVQDVWVVEDDPSHPLLGHLGIRFSDSLGEVQLKASSVEDWQREASRLEAQGKLEQAEAVRTTVLHQQKVPWTVLDDEGVRALAAKALDQKGVSQKARAQLFDYACFHDDAVIVDQLGEKVAYPPARDHRAHRPQVRRRLLQAYEAKNYKEVLWETEKYGLEFRTPMNLTPLMMAAAAGNAPLIDALVSRGARLDARDHLGRQAVHWAIRRAYRELDFAAGAFGAVFDAVAPASFDVQVEGRLIQIGREQGEYLPFQVLLARFSGLFYSSIAPVRDFTVDDIVDPPFEVFPEAVLFGYRKKRTYLNSVLARSEVRSSYGSSRRLWVRTRQGFYVLNPGLQLKAVGQDGAERWRPLLDVLNVSWLQSHQHPRAQGRFGAAAS